MANTNKGGAISKMRAKSRTKALAEEISKENTPDSPVVEHLQRQVANALVLYLNYKHYHWQTYGPMFRDLHRLFDEFAEAVLDTVDEFAERVRMIGQDPVASPQEMLQTASVKVAGRDTRAGGRGGSTPQGDSPRPRGHHLLHLTARRLKRPCGAGADGSRLEERPPPLRGLRRLG